MLVPGSHLASSVLLITTVITVACGTSETGGTSNGGGGGGSTSTGGSGAGGASAGGSIGVAADGGGSSGGGGVGAGGGNPGTGGGSPGTGGLSSTGGTPGTGGSSGGAGGINGSPPSCKGLAANCGPSSNEDCCTSPLVPGGTFHRSYDGVSLGATDKVFPAVVSDFRLDRFEITVGRFRKFKAAWDGGWRPAAGDGKHTHLNGGSGLDVAGHEPGWDTTWEPYVAPTPTNLACDVFQPAYWTWPNSPGGDESRPINCTNWYEAYAFCIWDRGFLPSEAEWNYAAASGSEQRAYPWSSPATSTTIDCSYANFGGATWPRTACVPAGTNDVGSESPKGDSRWGHADLGGNVQEWTLDWSTLLYSNVISCTNCAYLPVLPVSGTGRVVRGGSFRADASSLLSSNRYESEAVGRYSSIGARCARSP
jgi:formylglycine-generating enzyme required for sulfatase activity